MTTSSLRVLATTRNYSSNDGGSIGPTWATSFEAVATVAGEKSQPALWSELSGPSSSAPERVLLDAIAAGELDEHLVALADAIHARRRTPPTTSRRALPQRRAPLPTARARQTRLAQLAASNLNSLESHPIKPTERVGLIIAEATQLGVCARRQVVAFEAVVEGDEPVEPGSGQEQGGKERGGRWPPWRRRGRRGKGGGGTAVREPRKPKPGGSGDAIAVELGHDQEEASTPQPRPDPPVRRRRRRPSRSPR